MAHLMNWLPGGLPPPPGAPRGTPPMRHSTHPPPAPRCAAHRPPSAAAARATAPPQTRFQSVDSALKQRSASYFEFSCKPLTCLCRQCSTPTQRLMAACSRGPPDGYHSWFKARSPGRLHDLGFRHTSPTQRLISSVCLLAGHSQP